MAMAMPSWRAAGIQRAPATGAHRARSKTESTEVLALTAAKAVVSGQPAPIALVQMAKQVMGVPTTGDPA